MAQTPRDQDRKLVAGGQAYEVSYFARKHTITADEPTASSAT